MKIIDLFENNRASLFHATNLDAAPSIIGMDIIEANTNHIVKEINVKNKYLARDYMNKYIKGVSLTRSFEIAKNWNDNPVIFELDANKLMYNHKIIQMNYFHNDAIKNNPKHFECEEFVIGSIKNLSKYLIAICISEDTYDIIRDNFSEIGWGKITNSDLLEVY